MTKLQCENCGGRINPDTYVCEYCGTRYKKPDSMIPPTRLIVERPGVQTLSVMYQMGADEARILGQDAAAVYTDRLCCDLAEQLAPYIDLKTGYDVTTDSMLIRGRLRVVDPRMRF